MRVGIDTGGTFTDAALLDADGAVVASAKAPTTHHDLMGGVSAALHRVIDTAGVDTDRITSVALSTTLATNAMVERTGNGAALVAVGFDDNSMARIDGIDTASQVIRIPGGHDAQGRERTALGLEELRAALDVLAATDAVAVAALFAVRNQAHEVAVCQCLAADPRSARLPVTCSHDLSGRLDGPRRASTALANAMLTAPVGRLLDAFERSVRAAGIHAPLVVVRSDGSVMSLTQAIERPVETILSGPAASLVGGIHLAGVDDAVVVDIGGTTTDVAVVSNAVPEPVDDGAVVGGVATMVRSPRNTTEGLGGDSEVGWDQENSRLRIGPGRVMPLGRAQVLYPEIVDRLGEQLRRRIVAETDGLFCLTPDGALLEATSTFSARREYLAARRTAAQAGLQFVALTPTDAAWARGRVNGEEFGSAFDARASELGLELFADTLDRFGDKRYRSGADAGESILRAVERQTGAVIAAAVGLPITVWDHVGVPQELFDVKIELDRVVIGLGASAGLYHPPVGDLLGTEVLVPPFSEVANAVGAAVGSVRIRLTASITNPKRAGFVLHRPGVAARFESLEEAVEEGTRRLEQVLMGRH
ncbi:MAG: hydantoinase/oxoprolinase family protein, partial [Acidimicrobiia bacterium]|nr:hydantoinase/oxoprolinase family protein [Acidimicrobiia bacterium]